MRLRHLLLLAAVALAAAGAAACGADASNSLLGGSRDGTSGTNRDNGDGPTTGTTTGTSSGASSGGTSSGSSSTGPTVTLEDGGAVLTLEDGGTVTGRGLFEALLPTFQTQCGNACHELGGSGAPTYLGGTDPYVTCTGFPGIVAADPATSILMTKGVHEGPNLVDPLRSQITQWLTVEAASLAAAAPPITPPITVTTGTNTVDLSKLGVAGVSLSFSAAVSGDILTLTSMELAAPATSGVQVTFPIFYINAGTTQNEDDDFSNVAQTVPAGQSATLGTGILVITGWAAADTLQIAMTKIAAATAMDAGTTGGCKSVAIFTSQAAPAIEANTCLTCHNTGGSGNASLDLSALALATPNYATACAQALTRINTTTPASSDIITTPTGTGNPSHPFKTATQAYVTAMETWITAEK